MLRNRTNPVEETVSTYRNSGSPLSITPFPILVVRMGPNRPIPWHIQHCLKQVTQKGDSGGPERSSNHSPVHDEGWMVNGYERVFGWVPFP
jgi:hypothetical protein